MNFDIGRSGLALGAIRRYLEFQNELLFLRFAFERCNIAMEHGSPVAVRRNVDHISLALSASKHQIETHKAAQPTVPSSAPALVACYW